MSEKLAQIEAEIKMYDNAIGAHSKLIDEKRVELKVYVREREALQARVDAEKRVAEMTEVEREAMKASLAG
jgi:hypothetical protein